MPAVPVKPDAPGCARVADILARCHEVAPDSAAVITESDRHTFAELYAAARSVSEQLIPGTRVVVRLSNDAASVTAVHAAWMAGCSVVSAGSMVPAREVARRTRATSASAVLEPSTTGNLAVRVNPTGVEERAPDGEAVVMFTSGTTGTPKGASLSFAALRGSLAGIAVGTGLPADGRSPKTPARGPRLVLVPIALMGGFLACLTAWWLGKPPLLVEKFTPQGVLDLAKRFKIGLLAMTPAMVWELVQLDGVPTLPGIDGATVGTAALPEATRLAFEQKYGIPILRNYGQTEFAGAIAFERPADVAAGLRPDNSVGRVAPGVEVAILDGDGNPLPTGAIGELAARAASAMSGYLDERGHPAGHEEWLRTGDLGTLDDQGFVCVVGRVRDMLVCGGFNVYPAHVEAAINGLAGVADSAVAGMADERLGEVPVAAVVLHSRVTADGDAIRRELRSHLAAYEVPRLIVFVNAIPRRDTGKVDRDAVARIVKAQSE
jgi:long-chain acyl-CoA synthetase